MSTFYAIFVSTIEKYVDTLKTDKSETRKVETRCHIKVVFNFNFVKL